MMNEILLFIGGAFLGNAITLAYRKLNDGYSDIDIKLASIEERIKALEKEIEDLKETLKSICVKGW